MSRTLAPDDPRHGTPNGYRNYGCRCDDCRRAHAAAHLAWFHRNGYSPVNEARKRHRRTGEAVPIPYDAATLDARLSRRPDGQEPRTLQEWQFAADLAHLALSLDSARQYGLIEGGPEVDVERCEAMLDRAKARGIEPAPTAEVEAIFVASL